MVGVPEVDGGVAEVPLGAAKLYKSSNYRASSLYIDLMTRISNEMSGMF